MNYSYELLWPKQLITIRWGGAISMSCSYGGNMAYKTDKEAEVEFIDRVFYGTHTGEGHEVTEQADVYLFDDEG